MSEQPINDGGPAFPVINEEVQPQVGGGDFVVLNRHNGMSLRAWFAGRSLTGFLANERLCEAARLYAEEKGQTPESLIAERCVMFADELLLALKEDAK